MNVLKAALLAAILFASTPAFAFDDNRQGFILGFGAGYNTLKVGTNTGSRPENGLATSFKIGAGITDQIALYYVRNDSWFRAWSSAIRQSTYTLGISGIGASYFLAPGPSGYVLAAIGHGYSSAPFDSGNHPDTGRGHAFMFGGGYEYEKNLMVEGTLLTTHINPSTFPSVTLKSTSIQMTINYLFY